MDILSGAFYFVSDAFFEKIQDPYLKINYESTKRHNPLFSLPYHGFYVIVITQ